MSSGPHHRHMGWRDSSRRFTVVNRVSDQVSIAPSAVRLQSKSRMRSAISPAPIIREGTVRPLDEPCGRFDFWADASIVRLGPASLAATSRSPDREKLKRRTIGGRYNQSEATAMYG